MLFVNLWNTVSHSALAAYHAGGALLNSVTAAGNLVVIAVSLVRRDVRGVADSAVGLISSGADQASSSSQATAHAIQAANSAFWLLYDTVTGAYWLYSCVTGARTRIPPPDTSKANIEIEMEEIPALSEDELEEGFINIILTKPPETVRIQETSLNADPSHSRDVSSKASLSP